ncbi:hypothetical protein V5O48_005190 [Marasmius crinis-equi]|uniref:Major facilitator superfamily (MFS) profile domain-containing protein n=1 Tax=Marasmius crinis-equi TaxID=585013 RepID=A0ABR3FMY9_9AGAR
MATEPRKMKTTPLPRLQTTLACLISHAEPVTATVIYPFIPDFVRRTGITRGDERRTGYYAGVVESLFFISECLSVLYWGRASDRVGRRPILLLGPLGLGVAMIGFGLSKGFWQVMFWRCAQGVFNGNVGVVKTLIAEITDDTNLADALMLTSLMWTVGVTIGPAMGGILSDPADQWPHLFGGAFFREYPYFLACAAASLFAFVPFVLCWFFLKETLKKRICIGPTPTETDPLLLSGPPPSVTWHQKPRSPEPSLSSLITPNTPLQKSLTAHAFYSFSNMSYQVLIPLIYSTSIALGGLGLHPYTIGVIMGIDGVVNSVLCVGVWTPMLKRVGPKKMFLVSYAFHAGRVGILMCARVVAAREGCVSWVVWVLLAGQIGASSVAGTAYIGDAYLGLVDAAQALIVKSAPPESLGAVNGIQQMISSGLRGLAPTVASSVFALSLALSSSSSSLGGSGTVLGLGVMWRYLVDVLQITIIAVGVWMSRGLPSYTLC